MNISKEDCYTCVLARALETLRSGAGACLSYGSHALWGGVAWRRPIGATGFSLFSTFPSEYQQSAAEYLEYVAILLSGSASSYMDVSRSPCVAPDPQADYLCPRCKCTPPSRRYPLYCVNVPIAGCVRDTADSPIDLLRCNLAPADAMPDEQDPWRCHAPPPCGSLCGEPTPNAPPAEDAEARAGMADTLAFCIDRTPDGERKIRTKAALYHNLRYGGCLWELSAAAEHIGDSARSGHYAAIVSVGGGQYVRASDESITGPMSLEDAWLAIGAEPTILFYTNLGRTSGPSNPNTGADDGGGAAPSHRPPDHPAAE